MSTFCKSPRARPPWATMGPLRGPTGLIPSGDRLRYSADEGLS